MTEPIDFADVTPRFRLPRLHIAQAQKEFFVNEALGLIDILLCAQVAGMASAPPAGPPTSRTAYIIADPATGDWAGKSGQLALWLGSGWRFFAPPVNFIVLDAGADVQRRFDGTQWHANPQISVASGGITQDIEARAAITAILAALRNFRLIAE